MLVGNNHLSNIFAEVITAKTMFASVKPLAIANCQGEFRGLKNDMVNKFGGTVHEILREYHKNC